MTQEQIFDGLVELNFGRGVSTVQIYKADDGTVFAYVDESMADDVESAEEFKTEYGLKLYNNMEDFKRSNSIDIYKVWK